jgi:hypothetical protein
MKNTKKILKVTKEEMISIIIQIEKSKPNTLLSVKLRTLDTKILQKTKDTKEINPYFKQIFKISQKTYRLVTNYEQRVKNNLVKEGKNPNDFKVEAPKGKKHITDAILTDTSTETKRYLNIEYFKDVKNTIPTKYEFQGKNIDKLLFQKWISNTENKNNEKQNLENKVYPIHPNFDNILQISVNNTIYEIQH